MSDGAILHQTARFRSGTDLGPRRSSTYNQENSRHPMRWRRPQAGPGPLVALGVGKPLLRLLLSLLHCAAISSVRLRGARVSHRLKPG
ncbi:hypothetical protein MRX96_003848 [Rhipicephalus microplus]